MIKFKHILKSLLGYRLSSIMTISSLVISFLGIIILVFYVSFEKSFDKFNSGYQSIYRIETKLNRGQIPKVMADIIEKKIPEIEAMTTFTYTKGNISTTSSAANNGFPSEMMYCDSHFFDIFTLPLLSGDPKNALNDPNLVVLSEKFARKLFGKSNPLSETIVINNQEFRVSGVLKDFPMNSSFRSDCILSIATLLKNFPNVASNWGDWNYNSFVRIRDPKALNPAAEKIAHLPEIVSEMPKLTGNAKIEPDYFSLLPLSQIHFKEQLNFSSTNPFILNVLIGLIIVLMVMGAVNFINLFTAQAPARSKTFGVMQALGGNRFMMKKQIIYESVIISGVAFLISLALYFLVSIPLENMFGIHGISLGNRYIYLFFFLIFITLFGILVALFPSNYITSAPVSLALKGINKSSSKQYNYRNILLTIQFVFAICLISSAFVMEKQLRFWNNFDTGLSKELVVYFYTSPGHSEHTKALADELTKNRNIPGYTYAAFVPGDVEMGWGREVDGQQINIKCWPVDANFLDFFGIKIKDGRQFNKDSQADENSYILNEKAVSEFKWSNPLERRILGWDATGPVIGVMKDFNFSSLKEEIKPMMFWLTKFSSRILLLKVKPDNLQETIAYIKNTAQKFDPKNPVEVKFLDETLNQQYEKEQKTARFIEFVALWSIILGVVGLLGLVVFVCKERTKEIGIRKVNGAKVTEVMTMLNRDFVKWIALAFVIATPVSWYIMHKWLENFAYKTTLSWWVFALSGIAALGIRLLTVCWQSWTAATRNPVEALRHE